MRILPFNIRNRKIIAKHELYSAINKECIISVLVNCLLPSEQAIDKYNKNKLEQVKK